MKAINETTAKQKKLQNKETHTKKTIKIPHFIPTTCNLLEMKKKWKSVSTLFS